MYATIADMRALFGEGEIIALSDRAGTGQADDTLLIQALSRASSLADSYLARRHDVPLAEAPAVLTAVVCDIARYMLVGGPVSETDPIAERYRQALRWLSDVAQGRADLPLVTPGTDGKLTLEFASGRRAWAAAPPEEP